MRTVRAHEKSRGLDPVEHRIRIDTSVGATPFCELHDEVVDILLHEIDRLGTGVSCKIDPLGHCIDGENTFRAEEVGAPDGKLPDGPAAPNRDSLATLQIAEVGCHVSGGKDVGQE